MLGFLIRTQDDGEIWISILFDFHALLEGVLRDLFLLDIDGAVGCHADRKRLLQVDLRAGGLRQVQIDGLLHHHRQHGHHEEDQKEEDDIDHRDDHDLRLLLYIH